MKTGLFFLFSAAGLFIVSCNHKQSPPQTGPGHSGQPNGGIIADNHTPVQDSLVSSSWYVKGCAAVADTRSFSKGEYSDKNDLRAPGENGIRSEGDSIIYTRHVDHGCCRKVKVNTEKQGNVITITEFWWGEICKCMCNSDVKAVVRDLAKGEYQVYAIETGTNPFDNKPTDLKDTVMSQHVTIK